MEEILLREEISHSGRMLLRKELSQIGIKERANPERLIYVLVIRKSLKRARGLVRIRRQPPKL